MTYIHLRLSLLLSCLAAFLSSFAFAESYPLEATSANSIRRAETIVEGHFTGSTNNILVSYGTFQEVKTLREFIVTGVIHGDGLSVNELLEISTVGGEKDGVLTEGSFVSPAEGRTVVLGVQPKKHVGYDNKGVKTHVITNEEVFESDFSKDGLDIHDWVVKVKNATIKEYNEMLYKELKEKHPEKYANDSEGSSSFDAHDHEKEYAAPELSASDHVKHSKPLSNDSNRKNRVGELAEDIENQQTDVKRVVIANQLEGLNKGTHGVLKNANVLATIDEQESSGVSFFLLMSGILLLSGTMVIYKIRKR